MPPKGMGTSNDSACEPRRSSLLMRSSSCVAWQRPVVGEESEQRLQCMRARMRAGARAESRQVATSWSHQGSHQAQGVCPGGRE